MTVTSAEDYAQVVAAMQANQIDQEMRRAFAIKAFRHTAQYDATVAGY